MVHNPGLYFRGDALCDIAAANGVAACAGISGRFRADAGESCDRSRLAPLAHDMRVGIVGGRRRGAHHGAARLRRRRARYAGIATEIGIEPAARHADAAQRSRPQPSALRRLRKLACDAGRPRLDGIQQERRGWPGRLARRRAEPVIGLRTRWRFGPAMTGEMDHFLLLGLWPAGVLPAANGLTGAAPPFLRFLSAFGFFFSLLLRI